MLREIVEARALEERRMWIRFDDGIAGEVAIAGAINQPGIYQLAAGETLGDLIDRKGEFVVLLLKHQMQRIEHRPGHVPVKVVGFQAKRIGVSEHARQAFRNPGARAFVDTDVNRAGNSAVFLRGFVARDASPFHLV